MTISDRIKARRIALNMSQTELAHRVGYKGRSAISKIENGENDIGQVMIQRYADALGVTPTYLLTGYGAENMTPAEVMPARVSEVEEIYRRLPRNKQKQLLEFARFLDKEGK